MWVWVLLTRSSCGNPCDGFGSTVHVLVLRLILQFLGRPRVRFLLATLRRCFSNSRPSPAYTPGLEVLLVPYAVMLRRQGEVLRSTCSGNIHG